MTDDLTVENPTPGVLRAADVLFRADSTDATCYGWVPQARDALAAALDVEEMGRVLEDHPDWYVKGESTADRMVYGCQGCTIVIGEGGDDGGDLLPVRASMAVHQAAALRAAILGADR